MAKGIINPPIDELLEKADSKYQLVIFASTSEDKPLSVALHEIHQDKLVLTKDEAAEA